ncbi:hypothetical protein A1O3_02112 [Capronia epimyces CBS 606.96]|uniref:Uncharacterized protein n=1 Tax=Capronia epimyces CBS 606.96 TaxID=1182542 RepID=W9Y933_9EURO|nr:uncharacterized protein A1O3_02112 [Capronia epimyces CBS 606.96]EXJ89048.1 hypothetical protein A1O3_02112 [Capronia epimyces CBS 606.96]
MTSERGLVEGNGDKAVPELVGGEAEGDSEAETLIQSPEKQRTTADNASVAGSANVTQPKADDLSGEAVATDADFQSRKRKRSSGDERDETPSSVFSRRSSPLSSPQVRTHSADTDSDVSGHIISRRSKPATGKAEDSTARLDDVDENQARRRRPSDILPTISKHRPKNSGAGDPGSSERRETRSATYPRHSSPERSASPRPPVKREHRRGVSTQFTLGDVERKKRGRPPALQTRRSGSADHRALSVTSEDSDSPPRLRPALHKFPSTDHDTMSPAKAAAAAAAAAPGPRKWRDKNGRTFLSRACNNNDLAMAKIKLAERPEDLNQADNAGNTPLQIAALEGFTEIVKFLLANKCEVNTRNIDKETPLIDAVENGHVQVVKLLLEHGANPRLGNAKGDEPYELVPQDDENYEEVRRLLAEAKEKQINQQSPKEQFEPLRETSSKPTSAASPRDSPPILGPRSPPALTSRRRTGRSESTRNDLLWQANTQENLTRLAAKGDVQGVANILNILQKAETESLIAAAKAGHEEVLQYLLGMGDPESDPEPIRHIKPGYNTPMLAAIGRGHPEVVKLLVEQSGFNPTRRLLKGKTYFEISAERKGEQWQKEYEILKAAYNKYAARKTRKASSPRLTRDSERVKSKAYRRSQSPVSSKLRKSSSSSPTLTHKSLPNKSPQFSNKERDREIGSADRLDRRRHSTTRKEAADFSMAVSSDQDQTVSTPRKAHLKRRSQSDLPQPPTLDSENGHRRRRLVTGKEHRRRTSLVAEGSSDDEKAKKPVKAEGRPSTALKRTRDSLSSESAATEEGENGRSTVKKRRTVVENSTGQWPLAMRKSSQTSSPTRERKVANPRPEANNMEFENPFSGDTVEVMEIASPSHQRKSSVTAGSQTGADKFSDPVKSETIEVDPTEAELKAQRQEEVRKAEEARQAEAARKAEEARQAEAARKAEEAKQAEAARKAEEARQAEAARKAEEARQAEVARKAEEARQRAVAQRLEDERIAAERAAEKAAEQRRLAEEQERERRRKAEEEAAALRKKEEEERQERIRRELEERQRRQEEQLRQQRLEMERRRREALPIVLSTAALMIDNNDPTVRSEAWLKKFLPLFTVRTAQLDQEAPPATQAELWIPNFQVAGLLVTKDLHLRRYTSLEVLPVTAEQRQRLWQVSRVMLSYEYETSGWNTSIQKAIQREEEERPKFMAMKELFWVKLSGFEDQIPRHPHLAGLRLRQQPISLRTLPQQMPMPTDEGSPVANGQSSPFSRPSPKLTNGVNNSQVSLVTGYGNGFTR